MASIHKITTPGGKVRWRVRWRSKGADGKTHNHSATFDTQREAKEYARKPSVAGQQRVDGSGARVTYAAYRETWIEHLWTLCEAQGRGVAQLSRNTVRNYVYASGLLLPSLGARRMGEITRGHCEDALIALQAQRPAKTIKLARAAARRMFTHAVSHNVMEANPMPGGRDFKLAIDRMAPPKAAAYTLEQVHNMANAAISTFQTKHFATGWAVLLLACLGCRRSELLGLRMCNVNLDAANPQCSIAGTVAVEPDRAGKSHVVYRPWGKTETSMRTFALSKMEVALFTLVRGDVQRMARQQGMAMTPNAFLFPAKGNIHAPMHPDTFSHRLQRLRNHCKIDPAIAPVHGLRHHAIRTLSSASVPFTTIAKRCGQKNASITMNTYMDPDDSDLQLAADALDRVWDLIKQGKGS